VPPVIGHVTDGGEEVDALPPLPLGGPDIAQERVQMPHQ
jgi:hypothetical protein